MVDHERYKCIGEERTRALEFELWRLWVKEIVRPKYGLKDNTQLPEEGENAVVIVPLPLFPIHKELPGATMLAEILLQKYEYHVPFYRQIQSFRHLGFPIPENTLSGWFKPAAVRRAQAVGFAKRLPASGRNDASGGGQAAQEGKEGVSLGGSFAMDCLVFFHYGEGSCSGETAKNLLAPFKGYLQCGGYGAYNVFEESLHARLVACMAHIRRGYEKALDEYALGEIQRLYRIERTAREKELTPAKRKALRKKLAVPILDSFERWMEQTYTTVLSKSLIGKAIAYNYSMWAQMKNYLLDGRLEIDNNGAYPNFSVIRTFRLTFI